MRPFTLERLDSLLKTAPKQTFWRHDVDFSLDAALKMAEFEAERGISAIYYLFWNIKQPFYSSREALEAEKQLVELGHRTGLHLDERLDNISKFAEIAPEIHVSFHCPTENVLWKTIPGLVSAYEPQWEGYYVADSTGTFRFGDPEDLVTSLAWQINLHPEWWFEPHWLDSVDEETYEEIFYDKHPRGGTFIGANR